MTIAQRVLITDNVRTIAHLLSCGWTVIGSDYRGRILQSA